MNTLPLLPESEMDSIAAYNGTRPVTRAQFLSDILALAERIPDTGHVLNLCKDRYWFAATLFASISRGILSIMPNSIAPEIITRLQGELPDIISISELPSSPYALPHLQAAGGSNLRQHPLIPRIPFEQRIMQVYTSGSTGKPQPHAKTFGRVFQCATAEAKRIWAIAGSPCAVLGTVPFQHMYGLESTIFLPVLGGGQLSSRLPFFPADVCSALSELNRPRLLVTTPFHLRKLVDSDIEYPGMAAIVTATAPLSLDLAQLAEARLKAPVVEIYGSTETGQLATRQPVRQQEWAAYDGISFEQHGESVTVTGAHLEGPQPLNDRLEMIDHSRFRLLGRNSDMVNVAGKRSSLVYLNHLLTSLPGVQDGVFCVPNGAQDISRLAAFVVAPGLCSVDITSLLRQHLDQVFLPRPIVFLDALPRDGNGKIPAGTVNTLISRYLS